jgi:hypothetical protein
MQNGGDSQPESNHSGHFRRRRRRRGLHSARLIASLLPDDSSERSKARKAESFLIRRFLPLTGIALVLGAAIMTVSSSDSAGGFLRSLRAFLQSPSGPDTVSNGDNLVWTLPNLPTVLPMLVCAAVIGMALVLTRKVSNLSAQAGILIGWILSTAWWSLQIMLTSNAVLYFGYLVASTLIFYALGRKNFNASFAGSSRIKRQIESGLILANGLVYYFSVLFVLGAINGPGAFSLPFTVLLAAFQLVPLSVASRKNTQYPAAPYLLLTGLLVCIIPALILEPPERFRDLIHFPILGATFAVFLALFSRQTNSKAAITVSLLSLLASVLWHLFQWGSDYGPQILAADPGLGWSSFYEGVSTGLSLILATAFIHHHFENPDVLLPRRSFNRAAFLKVVKGVTLGAVYLTGFLLFFYPMPAAFKDPDLLPAVWSAYTALYCSAMLFWLARQRSWFLQWLLVLSTVFVVVHLVITHSQSVDLRDAFAQTGVIAPAVLALHVAMVVLSLGLLASMAVRVKPVFAAKKEYVQFYFIYFPILMTLLALSETDQVVALTGPANAGAMEARLESTHEFPWSFTIMACALGFIVFGFIKKIRFIRIVALGLLFLAVAKIIVYDLIEMTASAKSMWMLLLGVSILVVAYVYPKLKNRFARRRERRRTEDR